jgi:hypothetical protein
MVIELNDKQLEGKVLVCLVLFENGADYGGDPAGTQQGNDGIQ